MDLRLLSGGAANGLVNRLVPAFTAATGMGISGDFGAVGGMRDRVLAGEPVDAIILTRRIVDELAAGGHVEAASVADVGRVATAVAVREGDARPDVSTADALRTALLAADAVYVPDTVKSTAGIHFAGVLEALGVRDVLADRIRGFPNGQTAMAAMAAGQDRNPIGCTQITEILNTAGVASCGSLPEPHGLETIYSAAVATGGNADAARVLIGLLTAPENADARAAAGFA